MSTVGTEAPNVSGRLIKDTTIKNYPTRTQRPRKPNYNQIHASRLPLTVQSLPVLIPHNPFSILQIVYTYALQLCSSPTSHPACPYIGYLSLESRSVNITDPATVRCLWEKGFFGKGSLSRSEPTWLDREMKRRGILRGETSEEATQKRRQERREFKKERARKEREAIEKQLRDEGKAGVITSGDIRDELPTQDGKGLSSASTGNLNLDVLATGDEGSPTNGEFLELPNVPQSPDSSKDMRSNGSGRKRDDAHANGFLGKHPSSDDSMKPTEQNRHISQPAEDSRAVDAIINQEHLQLTLEEAFFLCYGLGVLEIRGEESKDALSTPSLLSICRRLSYFPSRQPNLLQMDDPFILSYVVYHHFRSLGWVIRSGVKFAVDYLLYNRGPVFSHAEFAVVIIPSYSHPFYSQSSAQKQELSKERQPWWWLHCINRVQSQVRKSLVLAFVEVPPPETGNKECNELASTDISRLLKSYKIREVNIKRWIPNRSRD